MRAPRFIAIVVVLTWIAIAAPHVRAGDFLSDLNNTLNQVQGVQRNQFRTTADERARAAGIQ